MKLNLNSVSSFSLHTYSLKHVTLFSTLCDFIGRNFHRFVALVLSFFHCEIFQNIPSTRFYTVCRYIFRYIFRRPIQNRNSKSDQFSKISYNNLKFLCDIIITKVSSSKVCSYTFSFVRNRLFLTEFFRPQIIKNDENMFLSE